MGTIIISVILAAVVGVAVYFYVAIFAGIYLCYTVINLLLMRKLNRVSQTEVLKNRE